MIRIRSMHPLPQPGRPVPAATDVPRTELPDPIRELEIDYCGWTYVLRIVPRGEPPSRA